MVFSSVLGGPPAPPATGGPSVSRDTIRPVTDRPGLRVPLGDRDVPVTVPAGWRVTVALPAVRPALPDLDAAIGEALARPMAGPTLRELAAQASARAREAHRPPRATIVVTDATRDCPDDLFLPPLLAEIEAGGIASSHIVILVGTGLHRASTDAEKRRMLGHAIVDLGRTTAGIPATTNRGALEADLLVSTGVVEPHQYAGYSGGAKTVAIGVAGEATITATHGISIVDDPGVRLGRLEGNPFHEAVVEIGRLVGLDFVINVVADPDGRSLAVAAGEPEAVHQALAKIAAETFTVAIPRQTDVAVVGVGAPQDANLYQATRGVTYLHFGPTAAVRPGGVYILPATIPEGGGQGLGERRFFDALRGARSPAELMDRLRRDCIRAGEGRAYLVAGVLRDAAIVVAGAERPDVPAACGMRTAVALEEALALAGDLARSTLPSGERDRQLELLVVPHAIRTLPYVTDGR